VKEVKLNINPGVNTLHNKVPRFEFFFNYTKCWSVSAYPQKSFFLCFVFLPKSSWMETGEHFMVLYLGHRVILIRGLFCHFQNHILDFILRWSFVNFMASKTFFACLFMLFLIDDISTSILLLNAFCEYIHSRSQARNLVRSSRSHNHGLNASLQC
jgi:hypothetical protein